MAIWLQVRWSVVTNASCGCKRRIFTAIRKSLYNMYQNFLAPALKKQHRSQLMIETCIGIWCTSMKQSCSSAYRLLPRWSPLAKRSWNDKKATASFYKRFALVAWWMRGHCLKLFVFYTVDRNSHDSTDYWNREYRRRANGSCWNSVVPSTMLSSIQAQLGNGFQGKCAIKQIYLKLVMGKVSTRPRWSINLIKSLLSQTWLTVWKPDWCLSQALTVIDRKFDWRGRLTV